MDSCDYEIKDFPNQVYSTIDTPVLTIHGFRFQCQIEITSDKLLVVTFHPLMSTFEFDLTFSVKDKDGSIMESIDQHICVEIDISDQFELKTQNPIEDSWLNQDNGLNVQFTLIPTEADYSAQFEYIFEVLYSQLEGEEGLDEMAIQWLLGVAERTFLNEPTLIRFNSPVVIVGDLHGNFYDLIQIFKKEGRPETKKYLFLGDYVDRGYNSFSTILLLLALKIQYPSQIFLIRGNHENDAISSKYGFREEISSLFNVELYDKFLPVFDAMPLAALINQNIFCVHGGISPKIQNLNDISEIQRPICPVEGDPAFDLLWTDPSNQVEEYGPSPRGSSFIFGKKPAQEFLERNHLKLILRAHEMVPNGFLYNFGEDFPLITIFSASNYSGEGNNSGYAVLDENGNLELKNNDIMDKSTIDEFKSMNLNEYLQ